MDLMDGMDRIDAASRQSSRILVDPVPVRSPRTTRPLPCVSLQKSPDTIWYKVLLDPVGLVYYEWCYESRNWKRVLWATCSLRFRFPVFQRMSC